MTRRGARAWLLALFLAASGGAFAQGRPAVLEVAPLDPVAVGGVGDLAVTLTNEEGRPQDNKVIVLARDGVSVRRVRTDADGRASFRVPADLPPGTYDLAVTFIGTADYLPVTAHVPLVVRPLRLAVETVPPVPGIAFELEGRRLETGADGAVSFELTQAGDVEVRVLLEPEALLDATTRASFLRWGDSVFEPYRTVAVRGDTTLQAGLALSHPVDLTFEDTAGTPVDPTRVSSVGLQASNGVHLSISEPEGVWLQANRVQRLASGMIPAPIQYAVESVTVDGSNVVNRYQQRFLAEPGLRVPVRLLFYSLRVRARDAVFGHAIGTGFTLTFPDGSERHLEASASRDVSVDGLARGLYRVETAGVVGPTPATPIALSRDQDVELTVLTGLDLAAGALLGLVGALGLLFYGRPHLIGLSRGRRAPPADVPEAARGRS